MSHFRLSKLLSVALFFVLVACQVQTTPSATPIPPTSTPEKPILPGASGTPVEYVSTPSVEIIGIYMITDLKELDTPETISNVFPRGITELTFAIKLKELPSELSIEIYNNDGSIEIPRGFWQTVSNVNTGEYTTSLIIESPTGVFADGTYQTKVRIDGELVALLNWSVGK